MINDACCDCSRDVPVVIASPEGVPDAAVVPVVGAVDAIGIDLEQDSDTVAEATCHLRGGYPSVEPEGGGGVPKVVGAADEWGSNLRRSQGGPASEFPPPIPNRR